MKRCWSGICTSGTRSAPRRRTCNSRTLDAQGVPLTDERIAAAYLRALRSAAALGVIPCFEVHVNMWSEHFGRIERVADLVERAGMRFNITLDASHVIFKIDNPREQAVQGMRDDVLRGRVILDPFDSRSVTERWIRRDLVGHAHARPAVPNNPINIWGKHPDGKPGRGIQYPFTRPPQEHVACRMERSCARTVEASDAVAAEVSCARAAAARYCISALKSYPSPTTARARGIPCSRTASRAPPGCANPGNAVCAASAGSHRRTHAVSH